MLKKPRKRPAKPGVGGRHSAETEATVCKYHAEGLSQRAIVDRMREVHGMSITRQTVAAIVKRASPYAIPLGLPPKLLEDGEALDINYFIALLYDRLNDGWEHLGIKDRYSISTYRLHANLVAQLLSRIDPPKEKSTNDDARKAVDELVSKLRAPVEVLATQTELN